MNNISNDLPTKRTNQFNILLDSYEGPIDLLLDLARKQKVDLSEISILALAQQYLDFIDKNKELHLEIAADYLVMAAWLTYLKSRMMLPIEDKEEEHTSDELEEALKYQIQRLEAMQNISKILYSKPLIGRDVFYGSSLEGINIKYKVTFSSSLFDLLKSYSLILNKNDKISFLTINSSDLYSVNAAIQRLKGLFGTINEWTNFINLIPSFNQNRIANRSIITSHFVASLELAKNGFIEVKQNEMFGNIFIKSKK